jgi:hypothetical protein
MEVTSQFQALAALPPGKTAPESIEQEAVWVSESVWAQWRREESYPAGNWRRASQSLARRYTDGTIPSPT